MDDYLEAHAVWDDDPGLTEYDLIRSLLRPEYWSLSDQELDLRLAEILSRMSPAEVESFWSTLGRGLRQVGRVAQRVAPTILPVAGTALGTLAGGPAGAALGGALGRMGAQVLGGARPAASPPLQPPGAVAPAAPLPGAAAAPAIPAATPLPAGGTSAAAQLLGLIQHPALLQALLGQILGPLGQTTTPVGREGTPVPFGAFMNALSSLANLAAAEAQEGAPVEAVTYLQDSQGNFVVDPANPEARAARLLELLQETPFYEEEPVDAVSEWLAAAGLLR